MYSEDYGLYKESPEYDWSYALTPCSVDVSQTKHLKVCVCTAHYSVSECLMSQMFDIMLLV